MCEYNKELAQPLIRNKSNEQVRDYVIDDSQIY